MEIKQIEIGKIKPYERNAKKHDSKQIKNVAESIKQFGFVQPIVIDKDYNIIIGHCRFEAAKRLKYSEVPCLYAENLSQDQVDKLRLLDNKLNESDWDMDLLAEDIPGLDFSGFDIDWDLEENDDKEIVEDDIPDLPEEPVSKLGDVYQLGNHRVMCGDSTKIADVKTLLGDVEFADLVVTDPPYNMGYQGAGNTPKEKRKNNKILNDKMSDEDFHKFLRSVYDCYNEAMGDGASIYVFYKELGTGVFMQTMKEAGITFKQELIWVKDHLVLGGSKYQSIYEPCLMGCKGKSIKVWHGGRKQKSVIESIDFMGEDELRQTIKDILAEDDPDVIREKKTLKNDLHPTMKPVRLIAKFIKNSSDKGQNVLDLFGGSGTTLMAAEQTDKNAFLMELDPKYVDVIVKRWEDFTGNKAILLERK